MKTQTRLCGNCKHYLENMLYSEEGYCRKDNMWKRRPWCIATKCPHYEEDTIVYFREGKKCLIDSKYEAELAKQKKEACDKMTEQVGGDWV